MEAIGRPAEARHRGFHHKSRFEATKVRERPGTCLPYILRHIALEHSRYPRSCWVTKTHMKTLGVAGNAGTFPVSTSMELRRTDPSNSRGYGARSRELQEPRGRGGKKSRRSYRRFGSVQIPVGFRQAPTASVPHTISPMTSVLSTPTE
jgi:hypothetical protein